MLAAETRRPGYRFSFEPFAGRVRAMFNGIEVADSSRTMVMRETRLDPAIYFPREDVRMAYLSATTHHTYCPFKGNASYWTLQVGERKAKNALWSYEDPLPDAGHIKAYVSFYPDRLDQILVGDAPFAPHTENASDPFERDPFEKGSFDNPLVRWIVHDAPAIEGARALTGELCRAMVDAGIPVFRVQVAIRILHPQLVSYGFRWYRSGDGVEETNASWEVLDRPAFLNSPFRPIYEGAGGVRRRLEGDDVELDFDVLSELREQGGTDYVAMPMTFSDGRIHAITLTSDRPGGFTTGDLGQVYEILGLLGRLYEADAMRRTAKTLLETYLGPDAGARVWQGLIKRGDGETLDAVIWFCDLRESTPLAQSMSRDAFLGVLNQFFDCMAGAVLKHDGQVLRFIGDAALAIFPIENAMQHRDVCLRAAAAAREAVARMEALNDERRLSGEAPLGYGLALHCGELSYGNIGVSERLEFTVIGEAANRAARIESMCKVLDEHVLVSSEVAECLGEGARSLGHHELRGVAEPVEIYALEVGVGSNRHLENQ